MADRGMTEFTHNGVDYTINDPNNAPEFDYREAYKRNDFVTRYGKMYRITDDSAAGTYWQQVSSEETTIEKELQKTQRAAVSFDAAKGIQIGVNAQGNGALPRALSVAFDTENRAVTVQVDSLPENIKYEIEWYSGTAASSWAASDTGWITKTGRKNYINKTKRYMRVLFGTIDDSTMDALDLSGLQMRVLVGDIPDAIDSVLDCKTGILINLLYGRQAAGGWAQTRALSQPMRLNDGQLYIQVDYLPSNIKFEVEYYTGEEASTFDHSSGGWLTKTGFYSFKDSTGNCPYIRVLFGTVDNDAITEEMFAGLKMALIMGETADLVAKATEQKKGTEPKRLKVCTYNMGQFDLGGTGNVPADAVARMKKFLCENNFDVIAFQEYADHVNNVDVDATVYSVLYPDSVVSDGSFKTSIKSSYKMANKSNIGRSRPWCAGRIQVAGKEILLMSVHFHIYESGWEDDFDYLKNYLANYDSFIVMGDFNLANTAYSDAAAQARIDQFKALGYNTANGGLLGLIHTQQSDAALDNIITSSDIIIRNSSAMVEKYNDLFSDHYPFVAELLVNV